MTKRLLFSDSHIPYCNPRFLDFLDMAEEEADEIIGVGDVFDTLRIPFEDIITSDPGRMIYDRMLRVAEKISHRVPPQHPHNTKPFKLIEGNHDPDLGRWQEHLPNITIMDKYEVDGWVIEHGYRFDPICAHVPWRILQAVVSGLWSTPGKLKQKRRTEKYHRAVGWIHGTALEDLQRSDHVGRIMGHTHFGLIIQGEQEKTLADCGDFVDSASYIILEDGQAKLVTVEESCR